MSFSARLSAALALVDPCDELWDIGCDHGLLGRHAYLCGKARRVHFVDPALNVTSKLRETMGAHIPAQAFNIHQIKGHEIQIGEGAGKQCFVMLGFGGLQIVRALQHLTRVLRPGAQFVLSPHRDALRLREFLQHGTWHLEEESFQRENQQCYLLLKLENRAGTRPSLYGGPELWSGPVAESYRGHLLKVLPAHENLRDQAYLKFLQQLG